MRSSCRALDYDGKKYLIVIRVKIYCGGVRAKLLRERIASERHERNRFNGVFLGYVEKRTISADGIFCDRYAAISSAVYLLPMKKAGMICRAYYLFVSSEPCHEPGKEAMDVVPLPRTL